MKLHESKDLGWDKGREIQEIPLAKLQAAAKRCRETRIVKFLDYDIDELAESIKEQGVLNPIMLRTDGSIVDGLRRVVAATQAGRVTIPAVVV